jgi:hypothetical protein
MEVCMAAPHRAAINCGPQSYGRKTNGGQRQ